MGTIFALLLAVVLTVLCPSVSRAQSAQSGATVSVPRVISVSGMYQPADGTLAPAGTVVTLAIYADEQGGAPLWQETQNIALDKAGRFTLLLGLTQPDGIPLELFASGDARWLGMHFAGPGEAERPRTRITSVPYALRASDADTLGGKPASAYLLAPTAADSAARTASTTSSAGSDTGGSTSPAATANVVQAGTPNFLAKYVNSTDVGNSAVYESGGAVGIGTPTPFDSLHVRFTNTVGSLTGYAVQNLGNTPTSYSGMLFYDQNGALGQFQGFNNFTHEYRINNIAQNGASQYNGSINFMIGSTSRFLVASNGNIGIGTVFPTANLEVSNATNTSPFGTMLATSFTGAASAGTLFIGRKARGTSAAPTAVQTGDNLAGYLGQGYGATAWGGPRGGMFVRAEENWTDVAQGTSLVFNTTSIGTITPGTKMTLDPAGNLGIGTSFPGEALEVSRIGADAAMLATVYANGGNNAAFYVTRRANGSPAAPAAVQSGDLLGAWIAFGYGATQFGEGSGGMGVIAQENWTDTAQGAATGFLATPIGSVDPHLYMGILPSGNVGIGDWPLEGSPTAADKLQVFGDVRIGTSGTNGCVKNFAGTGILGSCSSDRRLKKNITPFGPALERVTALQPVHFNWRADEFPERHLGDGRAYGLIAQDVEAVLPELVTINGDGFKAIDYSKLPLLTIQAMKELKAENEALKNRISALERLLDDLLAGRSRQ